MSSRKRAREDEDVQIKVAAGQPVAAESFVLRALSSCARALPADAAEWDVSGLLYDGQPFSRETVSCWLHCCYSSNYGTELGVDSISLIGTVTGLTQVLAFANAVGSYAGVLNAACTQLEQLKVVVQLPEQLVELPLLGYAYFYSKSSHQLMQFHLHSMGSAKVGAPLASPEQCRHIAQQKAKQLSALLQLAHVLRLQPLLNLLHQFLLLNAGPAGGSVLLAGVTGLIFSDAVLEAALGNSTLSKEAYINSVLSQPCSLMPDSIGHNSLLKPIGVPTYDVVTKALKFHAHLLRDFVGAKAGATVQVELALFEGNITLQLPSYTSVLNLPVQLLLGRNFSDSASADAFFNGNAAA